MAQHIELGSLPLVWRVNSDGALFVEPDDRSPEGRDAVRALAAALGVDTDESEITSKIDGQRLSVVSLHHSTMIAGSPVYATAYLPVEDGAQ
ncbi:hypothetical protein ACGFZP_05315 [Kitasatospora sp. NPDC048239]|uniref:hypothetical protein n=1 Tax=Kitasatospora sp. NPDC048239 TaxID=3364046 RepID=UPI0037236D41